MALRRLAILLLLTILLLGRLSFSQQSPAAKRMTIGLALEGGSALGLAHIGVLRWMEEHHVPVDYVAGTSMGALIGGAYATGESPAEIAQTVRTINWHEVLRGEIPFTNITYRRKQDAQEYPNALEFGIRNGIRFPEGFNSGHQVGLILDDIALPYSDVSSFDELPIPFACVGTDLVSAKEHVFRSGPLTEALRASMSIPGVFSPVRTGSSVLIDGGLLQNLPVDVVKEMGADLVIAVHLQTSPLEPNASLSSVGVLSRSVSVVIAANELRSMEKADVLVSVPLQRYGSNDYEDAEKIIKSGYDAAESKASLLSTFSVDDTTWFEYVGQREARRKTAPIPQFIQISGTHPLLAREIQERLSDNLGKPIDAMHLDERLTSLAGIGRYSRLGYRMVHRDHDYGLLIVADEKQYAPPTVRPLVVVDGSEYDRVQFLLGARITFLDVGGFGSEWRNDIIFGSQHAIRSEFFRPIGKSLRWFVAPQAFADNSQLDFFRKNTLVAEYRNREVGGAFDVGYSLSDRAELRVGYKIAEERFSPSVGSAPFGTLSGPVGITSARYNLIGRDDPTIPTKGTDAELRAAWYNANPGARSEFPLVESRITSFVPLNERSSMWFSGLGGTTFEHDNTGLPPFSLGGSRDLVAYGSNEFLTHQYVLAKIGYIHSLWNLPPLVGKKIYFLGAYEIGKVYATSDGSSWPTDAYGGLVMNTIFGPVLVGGAYGASGHQKFFFRIGRLF